MTRWCSRQKQFKIANCTCHDLNEVLKLMVVSGGCNEKHLLKDHREVGTVDEFTFKTGERAFMHQHEGAMEYIYRLMVWAQSTLPVSHGDFLS